MGLNIKNSATEAAIRELATWRGVGLTEAVDQVVREALRKRDQVEAVEAARRLKVIREVQARVAARRTQNPRSSQQIIDEMYGEFGEPV